MRIYRFETIDSTQTAAAKLATEGCDDMTAVVARIQTHARGRYERQWESSLGGLWVTFILRKLIDIERLPYLALAVGAGLYDFFKCMNLNVTLKYPNDILVEGKKLVGILCGSRIRGKEYLFSLVGIGINVNNTTPDIGVSLKELTNKEFGFDQLLHDVSNVVETARDSLNNLEPSQIISALNLRNCINMPLTNFGEIIR
ncbi:MAG TPA: biotin--[acetyl-CoA-carboxylase] ligase [Caldisericia bacterium]|nr:biotin--[acetyl-CoA-carboxylase] ligase [Caldisericia bacterium]HPF48972.1 biotin--[acetyl-CoA-carboxylase] ligase [Caldisericia bacterium]HPI83164.1 biotin--[acetyl-CoA-carboxylase] ligase [Caldisericia bacterium]HPQ92391.1 biotin--[acetyl-CoA-carboxylase] ligase [Caldisericia bacterium]HRV74511.1 biotin--[acetyl-CoA-carboxylase] ligase [Caldisericia bacterium]